MNKASITQAAKWIAIQEVKEAIKKAGGRISDFRVAEIRKAAMKVLADPTEGKRIRAKAKRRMSNV